MRPTVPLTALPLALILLVPACSSAGSVSPAPSVSTTRTTSRTPCISGAPSDDPSPRPAETIGAGRPPSAPIRVELTAGPRPDEATVRAVSAPRASYDAVQLRVFVNGCTVPYTDEGDELPTETLSGLDHGDHVEVLARFDGEGGNSAETRSTPITVP